MEMPDLSFMTTKDLLDLAFGCAKSRDPSDQAFAKACLKEVAKRKPTTEQPNG